MHEERLRDLIAKVASGEINEASAFERLRNLPYEDIGFANVDHHRQLRQGLPEVIFCPGKTSQQILGIAAKLSHQNKLVIASRVNAEQAEEITKASQTANYLADSRTILWGDIPEAVEELGHVLIVTAGTSDLPVAREAEIILQCCSISTKLIADVGVAGLHRVITRIPDLREAKVCIVIAGMDGVLPSVVGGLVDCPVIACPTSVGYGASFDGLAALLTMLNSCSSGLTVVNIDNGFGAAIAAFRIMRARQQA